MLNRMLFLSVSENMQDPNFRAIFETGEYHLPFQDAKYPHLLVLKHWLENQELTGLPETLQVKNDKNFFCELFEICQYYCIPSLKKDLVDWLYKKFSESKISALLELGLVSGVNELVQLAVQDFNQKVPFLNLKFINEKKFTMKMTGYGDIESDLGKRSSYLVSVLGILQFHDVAIHFRVDTIDPIKGGEEILSWLFATLPPLTSIAIDECSWVSKQTVIWGAKASGDRLLHLRFNRCGEFDDEGINILRDYCPNLKACYFRFDEEDEDGDASQEAVIDLFNKCKDLKTLRFYFSALAPSLEGDGYDVGILNVLEKEFPDRQIKLNYRFEDWD